MEWDIGGSTKKSPKKQEPELNGKKGESWLEITYNDHK